MAMRALRNAASGGFGKFILFGFLVLAAGGLVMMDVGGFFRGGVTKSDVARVGRDSVGLIEFDRNLRQTLRRIGLSPEDAYKMGYVSELLNNEIKSRLITKAADDTGLLISRAHVSNHIHTLIEPLIQGGQNPQDVLDQLLRAQGISEGQMIESVRRDTAKNLMAGAIATGFGVPSPFMAQDLLAFREEKRTVQYILLPESDIKDIAPPSDDQLMQLYEATRESYAISEMYDFQLVTVKTDTLKDTLQIGEDTLRQAYDENIDLYTHPERRTLEQAIVETEEGAKAIAAKVKAGKTSLKDAVQDITSNFNGYIEAQSFEKGGVLDSIREPVFEASAGDILGPLESPLGWHVIIVSKTESAHTQPFEEVKNKIRDELVESKLLDEQYNLANTVDDLLAGGASLEDVAQQVDVEITPLSTMNGFGQSPDGKDALKAYADDRAAFLDTGLTLEEGQTSPIFETKSGSFVALHLQKQTPKSYTPFEEVKTAIEKRWMADQRRAENTARVKALLEELRTGTRSFKDAAKSEGKALATLTDISRADTPKAPLTPAGLAALFEAQPDEPLSIPLKDGVAIARVLDVHLPESIAPQTEEARKDAENLDKALVKSTRTEALALYLESKRAQYGVRVNAALLERSYGAGPESY
ncbi:MAG: peptidyl-prolyl cis-trans isomerase [Alphaproteobacteria bacterium]|nr:peptidyl-prolyl cis-trans isomerase [Alphaproteobacteria bacterium]